MFFKFLIQVEDIKILTKQIVIGFLIEVEIRFFGSIDLNFVKSV